MTHLVDTKTSKGLTLGLTIAGTDARETTGEQITTPGVMEVNGL